MKFLDLFAGIGGFRRGLERSGHTCIGHVEIDKYANKSYMAMYGLEACPYGVDSGPNSCKMCSPEVREDCDGCRLYNSDAADERTSVSICGRSLHSQTQNE